MTNVNGSLHRWHVSVISLGCIERPSLPGTGSPTGAPGIRDFDIVPMFHLDPLLHLIKMIASVPKQVRPVESVYRLPAPAHHATFTYPALMAFLRVVGLPLSPMYSATVLPT